MEKGIYWREIHWIERKSRIKFRNNRHSVLWGSGQQELMGYLPTGSVGPKFFKIFSVFVLFHSNV